MTYIKSISLCGLLLSAILITAPITGHADMYQAQQPDFCTKPVESWGVHDVLMAPFRGFMLIFSRSCD